MEDAGRLLFATASGRLTNRFSAAVKKCDDVRVLQACNLTQLLLDWELSLLVENAYTLASPHGAVPRVVEEYERLDV